MSSYRAYWTALAQAGKSSPKQARDLLKPYVKGPYLDHLVDGVRQMHAQDREPYGQVVPRVKEVWISKDDAKVVDCQDVSGAAMADSRTHQVIPGTGGKATANIEASMRRSSDGRWRLIELSIKEALCTPPSS
ncbi:hypothetical protein [Streptosporangium sp. NPDC051022]|uniref:hypothetical protein n=1 Tax=Streptosporangium sp. NPDC051022 TaxID=3155752 RepID=UPI00341F9DBA